MLFAVPPPDPWLHTHAGWDVHVYLLAGVTLAAAGILVWWSRRVSRQPPLSP